MSPIRAMAVLAAAALAIAAGGCGERPQVVQYKSGTYQGKPDTPPWIAQFKGDRQAWETAVNDRARFQNEYNRVQ